MMGDSNKVVKRCECGTRLVGKFKELNLCATCHNTKIKNNHTNEICNNVQCQNKISRINLSWWQTLWHLYNTHIIVTCLTIIWKLYKCHNVCHHEIFFIL